MTFIHLYTAMGQEAVFSSDSVPAVNDTLSVTRTTRSRTSNAIDALIETIYRVDTIKRIIIENKYSSLESQEIRAYCTPVKQNVV